MSLEPFVAITAGGRIEGEYAELAGTDVKALAPVRGKTMLDRALDAALAVAPAGRIAVVGGAGVRAVCDARGVRAVDESEDGAENVRRALRAWPADAALLYLTSDMPYVGGEALRGFVRAAPPEAVSMPLCEHAAFAARFQSAPPFGIRLAGERVVNGGAFLIPAGASARIGELASAFFDARKSPARMAALVGAMTLLRLATGRLSIDAIERRASGILGLPVAAVRACAPELGFDADAAAEYRYACAHE